MSPTASSPARGDDRRRLRLGLLAALLLALALCIRLWVREPPGGVSVDGEIPRPGGEPPEARVLEDMPPRPAAGEPPPPQPASVPSTDAPSSPQPASERVTGALDILGSDALNNVMLDWSGSFAERHPGIRTRVDCKGSSTAPIALAAGDANVGAMSRRMKPAEIAVCEARWGYAPTPIVIGFDALAAYVHLSNPIPRLSLGQLRSLWADDGRPGLRWGDVGLEGDLATHPVTLFGLNEASTAHAFLGSRVLGQGHHFRPGVRGQPSRAAVLAGVAQDPTGLGFAHLDGAGGVRAVPLSEEGREAVLPTRESVRSGAYPLSRPMFVYVRKDPKQGFEPIVRKFLRYVLSAEGQDMAARNDLIPVGDAIAVGEAARLD